jgi:DNA-binding PadR family transcriptional regulator
MFGRHHERFHGERPSCGEQKDFRGRGGFWGDRGEGWGRGRGRFGGEFGGRMFDGGELRLVILSYIAEKPSHGYEIIKGIEEQMGGAYVPSAGVVYPTLSLLEDEGFATVNVQGGKKLYSITDAGRTELEANKTRINDLLGRIRNVGDAFDRGRKPEVFRAMKNFKMALKYKFAQGTLTAEQVNRIAAIIDNAAKEIESIG